MTAPPFADGIPEALRELRTLVVARLGPDGSLLEATEGFERLRGDEATPARELFQQPAFADLAEQATGGWTLAHEGLFHVGPPGGEAASLTGRVWARDGELLVCAEQDLDAVWAMRDQVLELNEELVEVQRELARELRERERAEAALEAKADELERSNEALESFTSAVSHDLKEPLRTARGYLQLLEDRYGEDLDPEARELVDQAVAAADRMEALIQGLLAWSRVDTEARDPEPHDADEALDEALENLHASLEEHDATVEREPLPEVVVDPGQLVQVFQNLVSNGVKYSGDEPPRIEVWATREDELVRFHVRDHGIGIPEDERGEVFRVFRRGSGAGKTEGTGVGLSVCQRIVQRHGGEMDVDSTPGEGSVFSFTLPAPDA